jgi:hypothetical protein
LPEGTHPGDAVHLGDVAPADRQARYDLAGLTADHALFSAAIFGQAGLPFDPVAAVWAEAGWPVAEAPYRVVTSAAVVRGLRPPADRWVFACPKHRAGRLFAALDRIDIRHPAAGTWSAVRQLIPVLDRPAVDRMAVVPPAPPAVPVHLYGLTGATGSYVWLPAGDLWKELPCLTHRKGSKLSAPHTPLPPMAFRTNTKPRIW